MYRNSLISSLLLVFFIANLHAQGDDTDIIKPILLNKSALSGIGLQKIEMKDEPEKDFYQRNLYRGRDLSVYVVSTQTWNNKMVGFPFDEFVYMLHGEAMIKPANGPSQLFYSGDYFFAPKGYTGEWEIRAGQNLHYELSVISTSRTDTSKIVKGQHHQLFSRSKLSGAHIKLNQSGFYSEVLQNGVELTVTLEAEIPRKLNLDEGAVEEMIHLLSGQLTMVDLDGDEHVFYTGDFFIIPEGFKGSWISKGHGLVKYISVKRTQNVLN